MPKSTLYILVLALISIGCKKVPEANYTIEVLNCSTPFEVQFTNESKNFSHIEWLINDQLYTDQEPIVSLNAGEYSKVQLTAYNGRKTSYKSELFQPEWYYNLPSNGFSWRFPNCQNFLEVSFKDKSEGNIDSYIWDFGDGNSSFGKNPYHVYQSQGNYNVTLSIVRCEDTISASKTISIRPENVFPKSKFALYEGPNGGEGSDILLGNHIKFNNHSSHASSYLWDFGNGDQSTKQSPTYTYTSQGTYTITLTASCNGTSHQSTKTVTVDNPDRLKIKSVNLTKFPLNNGSTEWDYDPDEELGEVDLRPDIYLKLMKGTCLLYKSSTKTNQAPGSISWSVNKYLDNLDYEYKIQLYDDDSSADQLMSECEFEPDNFFGYGDYPDQISLSEGDFKVTLNVGWE